MAYRVLAAVNSSSFGLDRRVASLADAVSMVGAGHLRHVATLVAPTATTDADEALMVSSVRRAKLLSVLVSNADKAGEAYVVGLLSVAEDVYGVSMPDLLAELPLGTEATAALLDRTGEYGALLTLAEACERGDTDLVRRLVPDAPDHVLEEFAAANTWALARRAELTTEWDDETLAPVSSSHGLIRADRARWRSPGRRHDRWPARTPNRCCRS